MNLKQTIEADIKQAMLIKDKDRLRALRGIKSLILLAETEKGAGGVLSEEAEMKLLTKAAKQRKDAFDLFQENGREDLAEIERTELEVINNYLPKQLNEAELKDALKKIIEETGAAGPQDIGKVMGIASKRLAGKAEGKLISFHAKNLLAR